MDEKLARHKKRKKRILTGILAIVGVLAIAVTAFFTAYVADCQITGSQYGQEEEIENELFSTPMDQRFFYQFFRKLTHSQKQLNGVLSYGVFSRFVSKGDCHRKSNHRSCKLGTQSILF